MLLFQIFVYPSASLAISAVPQLPAGDELIAANYYPDNNQTTTYWGSVNPTTGALTRSPIAAPAEAEGGGYDETTKITWIMDYRCKFYSIADDNPTSAVLQFTLTLPGTSSCYGLQTLGNGKAIVTSAGSGSIIYVIDLTSGAAVTSDPLNGLQLEEGVSAIAIDSNNNIWVSSTDGYSLWQVNPINGAFTDEISLNRTLDYDAWSMDFDSQNKLWLAVWTSGGYSDPHTGIAQLDPYAIDPLSTYAFTETAFSNSWNSDAIWIKKSTNSALALAPIVANAYRADDLGSVYFAPKSSKLSDAAKKQLEAAVIANPSAVYKVIGYVQKSKKAKNPKSYSSLSLARAKAVETHLASLGAGVTFTVVSEAGLIPTKGGKSDKARRATLYAMTPVVQ